MKNDIYKKMMQSKMNNAGNAAKKGASPLGSKGGGLPSSPGLNQALNAAGAMRGGSAAGADNQGEGEEAKPKNQVEQAVDQAKEMAKEAAKEAVKKSVKEGAKKAFVEGILPVLPYILLALVIIIIVYLAIMIPIILISEKVEDAKAVVNGVNNFNEKMANVVSGDGFYLSSEVVTNKLKEAQKNYEKKDCSNKTSCYEDELDINMLLATIQTDNLVDSSVVDEIGIDNQVDDYEGGFSIEGFNSIDSEHTKSFYRVQNILLGSAEMGTALAKEDMGLIYFLVDYHVEWTCVAEPLDSVLSYADTFADIISVTSYKDSYLVKKSLVDYNPIFLPFQLQKALREYISFADQGYDFAKYAKDAGLYSDDDLDKKHLFSQIFSGRPKKCGLEKVGDQEVKTYPKPYLTRYNNYTSYLTYVKDIVIPMYYFDCKKCGDYTEEEKNRIISETITKICDLRNAAYSSSGTSNELFCEVDDEMNIKTYLNKTTGALRGDLSSIVLPAGSTGFNGEVHFFSQTDYKDYPYYGEGPSTISSSGCGPTALSIAISSLLEEEHDPVELTYLLCHEKHLCTYGDGTYRSAMEVIPPVYGLKSVSVGKNNEGVQRVVDALSTGEAIVIAIMGPGHFTNGGHYITLTGINDEGQVFVVDPNNGEKRGKNTWWDLNTIVSENDGEQTYRAFWIITKE